jgi:hypothetical protein
MNSVLFATLTSKSLVLPLLSKSAMLKYTKIYAKPRRISGYSRESRRRMEKTT